LTAAGHGEGHVAHQGEIWAANLDPALGREQAGRWPVAVVSVDQLGTGPSELCIAVPLTSRDRGVRLHLAVEPPEGGLRSASWAMPEQVRAISRDRLAVRWGTLRDATLIELIRRVRLLMRPPL
jgi:mRNA interferase MazF